jgi:GH15 family glucan-1,4-alpha-glucosidase
MTMKCLKLGLVNLLFLATLSGDMLFDGTWLFNIGDDSTWSAIDLNDSAWYPLTVPGSWEDQGFANYDGIAWYRIHFDADSSLFLYDTLFLNLGRINGADQTFFNGVLIGETGSFRSPGPVDSFITRCYALPLCLLQRQNTIALRINNQKGAGGIISGPVLLSLTPPTPVVRQNKIRPHCSVRQIPFSNGIAFANYHIINREYTDFSPHIYTRFDEVTETPRLVSSARTVLFQNRREIPLTELSTKSVGYIKGTGIVHHKLLGDNITLDQYAFSPFSFEKPIWIFYAVLEGNSVEEYSLNFEIIGEDQNLYIGKWSFRDKNRKWLFVICYYDDNIPNSKPYNILRKYKNEHPGFTALIKEIEWWKNWQALTLVPPDLSSEESAVYSQSLAVLKMAQCRDKFPAKGQIVSAFIPSPLATSAPLSMSFAINALILSGHYDEALAAIQFVMNGRCGKYKHYQWAGENTGLGRDYAVSVSRYFGNGTEAISTGQFGPEIYLGGFGLTLWNLRQYIDATNDIKFLEYYWPKISSEIADVIMNSTDETKLSVIDNGFYNPGAPKHYSFTAACNYRGLVDATWLARMINDEMKALEYENAAVTLHQQIKMNLYDENANVLKGFLEEISPDVSLDAAGVIALIWVFNPQDFISKSTLAVFENKLALNNGYRRFANIGVKPQHEWVFGNLLISILNQRMTNFNKAKELRDWVTNQACHNFGFIPEYYNYMNADYENEVPLYSLGAGIYISSFWGE